MHMQEITQDNQLHLGRRPGFPCMGLLAELFHAPGLGGSLSWEELRLWSQA